jgi:hypothetical protein
MDPVNEDSVRGAALGPAALGAATSLIAANTGLLAEAEATAEAASCVACAAESNAAAAISA